MRTSSFSFRLDLTAEEFGEMALAAFKAGLPVPDYIKRQLTAPLAPTWPATVIAEERRETVAAAPVVVAAEEEPEPVVTLRGEPAPAQSVRRKRRSKDQLPSGFLPLGFAAILEHGKKIAAERQRIVALVGKPTGHSYITAMSDWLHRNGYGDMHPGERFAAMHIGLNAEAVEQWQRRLRPGTVPNDVRPSKLLRLWQEVSGKPAREQQSPPAPPAPPPPEPELRKTERPVPPVSDDADHIPVWRPGSNGKSGRWEMLLIGDMTGPSAPAAAPEGPPEPPPALHYASFAEVDLGALPAADRRVLRRFSERMEDLSVATDGKPTPRDIAAALRKIRGDEVGDNTATSKTLVRLGVLAGLSGDFRLRKEYQDRFREVRDWMARMRSGAASQNEATATA